MQAQHTRPRVAALLALAEDAAREAGRLLVDRFERSGLVVERKDGSRELVTDADRAAEGIVRRRLLSVGREDGFVGEESGALAGTSGVTWLVDPLDGTLNFARGIPHWNVSIGCRVDGKNELGVVFDPLRDELFSAARGAGARLNGRPLRAAPPVPVEDAVVQLGWTADPRWETRAARARELVSCFFETRQLGSLALDLAWTAAGRLDACAYEYAGDAWELPAAEVVCAEAGIRVVTLPASARGSPLVVAGPPALAERLLRVLREPP